jgi:hypothetical protein
MSAGPLSGTWSPAGWYNKKGRPTVRSNGPGEDALKTRRTDQSYWPPAFFLRRSIALSRS